MNKIIRVVVALCYQGPNKFLIIPSCPYCFSSHQHRLTGILPLASKHSNGEVIEYHSDMPTKISECLLQGRTYCLELRPKEEIPIEKLICRGIKKNTEPCSLPARKGYCVCRHHISQYGDLITKRYKELTGT